MWWLSVSLSLERLPLEVEVVHQRASFGLCPRGGLVGFLARGERCGVRGGRGGGVRLGFLCGPVSRGRCNIDAVLLGPFDETVGVGRAKGMRDGPALLIVNLVEHRREDAPRFDELCGGDGERLVATAAVEEHPLVCVSRDEGPAVAELRGVPEPHRDRGTPLLASDPRADPRRLGDCHHVDGLIWLYAQHELVLRVDAHQPIVRLRAEADADLAESLVEALASREQEGHAAPPLVVDREDARGERGAR